MDDEIFIETNRAVKDLNENQNRAIRGERQFEFENNLDKLEGEPIGERFLTIRQALFKDVLVEGGLRMDQLISEKAPPTYPDRNLLAESLLPNYYKLVDDLHDQISSEENPQQKAEMGKRLAVLTYFVGVTLHQAPDGNGQTNKLISLSYIHEFCPQYKENFFPVKYDDGATDDSSYDHTSDLRWNSKSYFGKLKSTLPPIIREDDQKQFNIIKQIREIDKRSNIVGNPPEGWTNRQSESKRMLLDLISSSDIQISEETRENLGQSDPGGISLDIRTDISDVLDKKYPGYHFSVWGDSPPTADSTIAKEFAMTALLTEPDGRNVLEAYVKGGTNAAKSYEPEVGGERMKLFYTDTSDTLTFLEGEFDRVIGTETKSIHIQKHLDFVKRQK